MNQLGNSELYKQAIRIAPLFFAYGGYRSLSHYPGAAGVIDCIGWVLFAVAIFCWPKMFGARQLPPAPTFALRQNLLAYLTVAISLTLIVISVILWSSQKL